jgi:hypothetical protein
MSQCSRPGCTNEARAKNQRYCKRCAANAAKTYREHEHRKRFQKGVESLRRALLTNFETIGAGEMTGYTAASIVRTCEPEGST